MLRNKSLQPTLNYSNETSSLYLGITLRFADGHFEEPENREAVDMPSVPEKIGRPKLYAEAISNPGCITQGNHARYSDNLLFQQLNLE